MTLSTFLVFILVSTFRSPIGTYRSINDIQMCKLDERDDSFASLPNVTMVENPDILYVTCIHHTDGIRDYYYDSIPAKDCKVQKKYVEINEDKVEQLDKDVCPVPGRWPKCDISEFNVTFSTPIISPPAQPSLWFSLSSFVVQILDYFTMPTITWGLKIKDLRNNGCVQDIHLYRGTRIDPVADASVDTIQFIQDSDQEHHGGNTLGLHSHDSRQRSGNSPTTAAFPGATRVDTEQHQDPNVQRHVTSGLRPRTEFSGSSDNYDSDQGQKTTASHHKARTSQRTVDATTPRFKPTSGTARQPKPKRRVLTNDENYVRRNLKSGSRRRRSGREEWKLLYEQIDAILHAITPTPSPMATQMKEELSALVRTTTERATYIQQETTQIIILYTPVVAPIAAYLITGLIVFHFTVNYFAGKQNEREREEFLDEIFREETPQSRKTQNRGNNGSKQQQQQQQKQKQQKQQQQKQKQKKKNKKRRR